jgi:hypothetical protein
LHPLLTEVHAEPVRVDRRPCLEIVAGDFLQQRLRPGAAALQFQTVQRLLETLALDRLQQIVDRRRLERLERVDVVGGDEHDQRARRQTLQQFEPVHAGHVDVEEEHLDVVARDLG